MPPGGRPFARGHAQAQPGTQGLMLANAPGTQGETSVILHGHTDVMWPSPGDLGTVEMSLEGTTSSALKVLP